MKKFKQIVAVLIVLVSTCCWGEVKRLNNVVVQLVDIKTPQAGKVYKFELDDSHFIWVRLDCNMYCYANVRVLLDDRKTIIKGNARRVPAFSHGLPEAMIYLPAGKHKVRIMADGLYEMKRLRVFQIPEIHDYVYVEDLAYLYNRDSYRAFRWDWRKANGMFNYNVLVTMKPYKDKSALPVWEKRVGWWKSQGRRIIFNTGIPSKKNTPAEQAEQIAYTSWYKMFSNPLCDGVILDELGRTKWIFDRIPYWLKAAKRITSEYKNKEIIFFSVTSYEPKEDYLLKAVPQIERVYLAPEHYFPENQMGEFSSWSGGNMGKWQKVSPEIQKKCIIYLSCGNASTYAGYDTMYDMDYKAFLDRYVKYFVVDDKRFKGIRGIGFWKFNFLDEETYPYISALMRHYCILGKTKPFYKFPLKLRHIKNGSFEADSISPWEIVGENAESIVALTSLPIDKRTSWLRVPFGHKGLLIKPVKSVDIGQNMQNLIPGQKYQVECYAFSIKRKAVLPLKIKLIGGDIIKSKIEVSTKRDCLDVRKDNKASKAKKRITSYWNRIRAIFIPENTSAKLILKVKGKEGKTSSDDEFYIDFVQVQPYLQCEPYKEK